MTETAAPATPPKPRVTANDRALRQMRIFARMQEGWSYEAIAQDERLSRERIRQIVTQTLALREIDAIRDHTRLQIARLDPALRLAAERVAEGDLRAIDRLVKVLDRLDKFQIRAAAAEKAAGPVQHDDPENLKERLIAKLDRAAAAYQEAEADKLAAQAAARAAGEPDPYPDWGPGQNRFSALHDHSQRTVFTRSAQE
jgi:hypothetical protein